MDIDENLPHPAEMPKKTTQDPSKLDGPRRALYDAVFAQGHDLASLSRRLERNHAYLNQYLWRGTPVRLPEIERKKLAGILEIDESALRIGGSVKPVDKSTVMIEAETTSGLLFDTGARSHLSWPKDLKILGHAKAGVEGFFLDQGEVHGMAHRPPALSSVKDAFAVYVHDDSMVPKFEPGEVAWIHPYRPPAPGDYVIVELADGQAFIKRLVRRTASHVICMQFEPRREIKYEVKKVRRLYFVVGSYREE